MNLEWNRYKNRTGKLSSPDRNNITKYITKGNKKRSVWAVRADHTLSHLVLPRQALTSQAETRQAAQFRWLYLHGAKGMSFAVRFCPDSTG